MVLVQKFVYEHGVGWLATLGVAPRVAHAQLPMLPAQIVAT